MKTNRKYRLSFDLLLAFLLPAAIFLLLLLRFHILPFGELTLLFSDLDSQYVEFMSEYRRILLGEGSFFWSWHAGLGMNFMALTAYYLASPFNFLLVLFPEEGLPLAVSIITLLKISCAGTAFAYYLKNHYDSGSSLLPLFSAAYALSAYALGYAFNIMWLDALIWLPLLCAGIDRLLRSEKRGMCGLTVLFALSFISQFYIAWMTGVFCALYFLSQILIDRFPFKSFVRHALRFAVCVGIAAGLSAFLLLPTFFVLKNNMGSFGQEFPAVTGLFSVLQLLNKFFIGSFDGIKDCLPHIYCGIPAVIGMILYFTRKQIPARERIIHGLIFAFLLFSFWFAPLDFFWHALDHPSWFPFRYAFIFIFWMLTLAFDGFAHTQKPRELISGCAVTLVLFALPIIFDRKGGDALTLFLNLPFLFVYAAIAFLKNKKLRRVIGTALISAELFLNGMLLISEHIGGYTRLEDYRSFHTYYRDRTASVFPQGQDFYRMEKREHRNYNDPMGIGFPGISHFSSTASVRQTEFLKRLGFNCYATWCTYEGATGAADALLGIRYEFGESGKQDSLPADSGIWEHPAWFPLFFFAEDDFARYDFHSESDAITRQNDLLRLLDGSGSGSFFEPVPVQITALENLSADATGTYRHIDPGQKAYAQLQIETVPGKSLYLFLPGASLNVSVTAEGNELMNGNRDYAPFPICLDAYVSPDAPVSVRIELLNDPLELGFKAFALNTGQLAELSKTISAAAPQTERTGETTFRLSAASADEDRLIVSSIPFDAGWQVLADGKRLPLKMIHESVLGFILPAGTTEVTVQFVPYGFPAGAGLSGVAALLWLAILIFEKKASGNDPEAATQQAHQEYTHAVIPDKESADKG